jgi:hypothetical protein
MLGRRPVERHPFAGNSALVDPGASSHCYRLPTSNPIIPRPSSLQRIMLIPEAHRESLYPLKADHSPARAYHSTSAADIVMIDGVP